MGIVIITGIPGVGKTTVIDRAKNHYDFNVVNFGDVMLEHARQEDLVKHRDELRLLPIKTQREIQVESAKKIKLMKNVCVDTHCMVSTPDGFLPGLPIWVLENLKPSSIVIIEASAKEILQRREKDADRARDVFDEESILDQINFNRFYASACSVVSGATVKIIFNHDDTLEQCSLELGETVKRNMEK
jgi:adenylate kinase